MLSTSTQFLPPPGKPPFSTTLNEANYARVRKDRTVSGVFADYVLYFHGTLQGPACLDTGTGRACKEWPVSAFFFSLYKGEAVSATSLHYSWPARTSLQDRRSPVYCRSKFKQEPLRTITPAPRPLCKDRPKTAGLLRSFAFPLSRRSSHHVAIIDYIVCLSLSAALFF
ncbi:hypothetical protein NDU88_002735 [Pleurodeles waltl]|uniref:Uncharacterized protein n=1 Tax=Pleurodeles waltl TaxID=8319 RepID=A0AAV7QDJ2_PLEWA|nr:hypothetical protein NDU88_002735 [Pleurodeles waltl]